MAYNPYQYQYQNMYPQYQQPLSPLNQQLNPAQMNQPINNQQMQPQMQNGGFISVSSEEEAIKWAVAPGNVMTFKVQGKPIVIEKSMGFSQLEEPRIEKYRLVKEDATIPDPVPEVEYAPISSLDALRADFDDLKKEVDRLKAKSQEAFKPRNARKKEENDG